MKEKLLNCIQKKEEGISNKDFELFKSFHTGDLLSITMLASIENKRRINFLGLCIAKKNKGVNSSFLIRNIISNEGVEFNIPFYSPLLKNIQIVNKKKTRASKLYYVRRYSNLKINKF